MTADSKRFREILENRSEVLRYLLNSPATKPEMVSALRLSRSSVDRAVRDLTEIACVTEDGNKYRGTTTGRVALVEYDQYQERSRAIQHADQFLNYLPTDAVPDASLLHGAEITLAESHAPDQALAPSIELFEEATVLRGLAPVVLTFYPTLIEDELRNGDLSVEIVAEEAVINTLPELVGTHAKSFLENDGLSLYCAETNLPYALWLIETPDDSYAGITAYDTGGVVGVLITDSASAVQWAERQYTTYRDQAEAISTSDL